MAKLSEQPFKMEKPLKQIISEMEQIFPVTNKLENVFHMSLDNDEEWAYIFWILKMVALNFSQTTIDRWIESRCEIDKFDEQDNQKNR